MKKAGLSKSKSKIRRISKSTPTLSDVTLAGPPAGHLGASRDRDNDKDAFQAFQSNLLSLISHELRTPLLGVMNAVTWLETLIGELAEVPVSMREALEMARRNSARLQGSLAELLDLAALEAGVFRPRLREIELSRLITEATREVGVLWPNARFGKLTLAEGASSESGETGKAGGHELADPQKLVRAFVLLMDAAMSFSDQSMQIGLSSRTVSLRFKLNPGTEEEWQEAWLTGQAGVQSGVKPVSHFRPVVLSESEFLTRSREGLGSALILAQWIARVHEATLEMNQENGRVTLKFSLPARSRKDDLQAVLSSRVFEASTGVTDVGLLLVSVPGMPPQDLVETVRGALYRSTDSMYAIDDALAVVLSDCKPADMERIAKRIRESLPGAQLGAAHCPTDGAEADLLLAVARTRIQG